MLVICNMNLQKFYMKPNNQKITFENRDKIVKKLCTIKGKFKLNNYQKTPYEILKYYNRLLIFHGTGSGKTCTSINICEKMKNDYEKLPLIILGGPKLTHNYRKELKSECVGKKYNTDKKIDENYEIITFIGFLNGNYSFNNRIIIIDEIQNLLSINSKVYKLLLQKLHSSKNYKFIIMSATPLVDNPFEVSLLYNLLTEDNVYITTDKNQFLDYYTDIHILQNGLKTYKLKDDAKNFFSEIFKNKVSYYAGANPLTYPLSTTIGNEHYSGYKLVLCKMSSFQKKVYKISLKHLDIGTSIFDDICTTFLLHPRSASNFVFDDGNFASLGNKSRYINSIEHNNEGIKYNLNKLGKEIFKNIKNYSCKIHTLIDNVINFSNGPVFIYSNFVENGAGLDILEMTLQYLGYNNYFYTEKTGPKTYAIWKGMKTTKGEELRNNMLSIFNHKNNLDGSQIKILLGSPASQEGITLKNIDSVHILEPYWNEGKMEQIIARAIRYCSHLDTPFRIVKIYKYCAVGSIDEYIYQRSFYKNLIIQECLNVLKNSAIDCKQFYNINKTLNTKLKCIS